MALVFVHIHEYFEYSLSDLGYMGKEMFVMQQLGRHKLAVGHDLDGAHAYNEMHARYKI
jgi:hypothetical protein